MNEIFSAMGEIAKIMLKGFYHFLRKHPRYAFLLPFIVIAAIQRYTYVFSKPYLGVSEGDLTLVQQLLTGKLLFVGAPIVNHDFVLGPFYQYLIAFPLILFKGSPLGPALVAAGLGVLTVYIVYLIGKAMFNLQVGIFSAGLYAVSPFVISYVDESWSRDILPLFTALLVFFVYKSAASAKPFWYYMLVGMFLGICLQLYHLVVYVLVIIPLYILITEIVVKGKHFILPLLRYYFYMALGCIISLAPYLYYEAMTGFKNMTAQTNSIMVSLHNPALKEELLNVPYNFYMIFARFIVHYPSVDQAIYYTQSQLSLISIFAILLIVFSFIALIFDKNRFVLLLVALWVIIGSIFYTLYRQDVFMHQFTPLYTIFVLFVGYFLGSLFHLFDQDRVKMAQQLISSTADSQTYTTIPVDVTNKTKLYAHWFCIFVSVWIFALIAMLNFSFLPYHSYSKEEQDHAKKVTKFISEQTQKKPFNFSVLADPPDKGEVYLNAFTQQAPIDIAYIPLDPKRQTVAEQMFVVCEDPNCKPLLNNDPQIRGFGKAVIIKDWSNEGVKIYRLIHPVEH